MTYDKINEEMFCFHLMDGQHIRQLNREAREEFDLFMGNNDARHAYHCIRNGQFSDLGGAALKILEKVLTKPLDHHPVPRYRPSVGHIVRWIQYDAYPVGLVICISETVALVTQKDGVCYWVRLDDQLTLASEEDVDKFIEETGMRDRRTSGEATGMVRRDNP